MFTHRQAARVMLHWQAKGPHFVLFLAVLEKHGYRSECWQNAQKMASMIPTPC
jgi:hypothetical protein